MFKWVCVCVCVCAYVNRDTILRIAREERSHTLPNVVCQIFNVRARQKFQISNVQATVRQISQYPHPNNVCQL